MKSILFVCTGNIFRSMTAEYALKAALGPEAQDRVSSAGTQAIPQEMVPFVLHRLRQHGLDPSNHRQRRVTADMLRQTNLAVAMGLDHRAFLWEQFGYEAPLFNQICFGRAEPILDTWEAVPNYQHDPAAMAAYGMGVIDYICEAMPFFIANVADFITPLARTPGLT
jgi:protein-tyrosine phosphatase